MGCSFFAIGAQIFEEICLCALEHLVELCWNIQKWARFFSAAYLKWFRSKMGISTQTWGHFIFCQRIQNQRLKIHLKIKKIKLLKKYHRYDLRSLNATSITTDDNYKIKKQLD